MTLKAKQEEQKEKLGNTEMIARLIDIVEQSQGDEGGRGLLLRHGRQIILTVLLAW